MHTIFLVAANTLRVTFRRRARVITYFVVPILGVCLTFAVNAGGNGRPVRVGVADNDGGPIAAELLRSLRETAGFSTSTAWAAELGGLLTDGSLDAGIVIPAGYGDGILAGAAPVIRILSIQGEAVTAWLERYIGLFTSNLCVLAAAAGGDRTGFDTLYADMARRGARLTVSGLHDVATGRRTTIYSLGFLIYFATMGAGITMQLVLEERRNKTFSRVKSAPVRAGQYLAGSGFAGFLICVAQSAAVILMLRFAFTVETGIPDLLLFTILFVFAFTAVGFAMAVTAFSRTSFMASVLVNLILTPTCMISGCFWPAELMPRFLQRFALFLPQRWVLDAVQKAQSGAGLAEVAVNLLVIGGFALTLFLIASLRFSRLEESGQFV